MLVLGLAFAQLFLPFTIRNFALLFERPISTSANRYENTKTLDAAGPATAGDPVHLPDFNASPAMGSARRWRAVFCGPQKTSSHKLSPTKTKHRMGDDGLGGPSQPARAPRAPPVSILEFGLLSLRSFVADVVFRRERQCRHALRLAGHSQTHPAPNELGHDRQSFSERGGCGSAHFCHVTLPP